MLLLVPSQLRDAADALGVSRWRTVLGVVLPSAAGGILTGTVLAVARAAGETAPMLILCSIFNQSKVSFDLFGQAVPNIPTLIFTASEAADPAGFTRAWGAALVLLTFILLANVGARTLLARSRRKLTG
jgi:phosphate transport system permease protein